MKKKLVFLASVALMAGASFGVPQNSSNFNLSEIGLAGVEALASGETVCLNKPGSNTGACKKKVNGTGFSCVAAGSWDSKDCYGETVE